MNKSNSTTRKSKSTGLILNLTMITVQNLTKGSWAKYSNFGI